ncbi:uncharacterized protein LOC120611838 isoform X1 [Pteropus medius]|uniref:uncharacterized protein LOC120611838 isoform X1 n=1 Tax=Pteropus vampyrus TaxID=132908 RepID=UPI00196B67E0|nr:uncharacterized protein LOC120611838 isoform X1 [Pteropus giganteus]
MRCRDPQSQRVGAQATRYAPLSFSVHREHPWKEGPGRKPPQEQPRALNPFLSRSAGRLVRLSEGAFPLQSLIKASIIYPDFFTLSAQPCQNNDSDRANLQSSVVFRKIMYTPLTRPLLLLRGPSLLQLRHGAAPESAGHAWSGRLGFLLSRSLASCYPQRGDRRGGALSRRQAQGLRGPASCNRRLRDCNLSLTFRTACFKVTFQSRPRSLGPCIALNQRCSCWHCPLR